MQALRKRTQSMALSAARWVTSDEFQAAIGRLVSRLFCYAFVLSTLATDDRDVLLMNWVE